MDKALSLSLSLLNTSRRLRRHFLKLFCFSVSTCVHVVSKKNGGKYGSEDGDGKDGGGGRMRR
jgi:hypothetical protein